MKNLLLLSVILSFSFVSFAQENKNVNDKETNAKTLLYRAAEDSDFSRVKLMLDRGADPNIPTKQGFTPLGIAVYKNNLEIVKLLLSYNANIDQSTSLQGASPLYVAVVEGHTEIVKFLLSMKPNLNIIINNEQTALYMASALGHKGIAELLLLNGADINLTGQSGTTPLSIAVQERKYEIVKLLLENGANVNRCNSSGHSPILVATQSGNLEMVKFLLENNADPLLKGDERVIDLEIDETGSRTGVKGSIISYGFETKENSLSALRLAVINNHFDIANLLITFGADVNEINVSGESILMIAIEKGAIDIVRNLVENGANLEYNNRRDGPIIDYATKNGNVEVIKTLVSAGAKDIGHSLLMAVKNNQKDIIDIFLKSDNVRINFKDLKGNTPLILATKSNYNLIAKELIELGADVNAQNLKGFTPLIIAADLGNMEIIEFLMQNGADIELKTFDNNARKFCGVNALKIAKMRGHKTVYKYLKKYN